MNKQETILTLAKNELPQFKAIIGLNVQNADTETLAMQELQYLQMIGMSTPAIYECIPATVVMAIKTVLKQNLTLDPYAGLVYVKTRNVKVGEQWAKALEIQPSDNGLISINRQCGRILDIDRPEIVKDANGKVIGVKAKFLVPSFDEKRQPIAKWKEIEFDEDDFYRWQRASHNENGRNKNDKNDATLNYANPLYTNFKGGIDVEFARTKAIRHGLKKLGTNSNELRATSITIPVDQKKVVVDAAADIAASQDETNGHDYAEYEEVNHNGNGNSNGNGVKVTVHEEMYVPNANEL
jgi:hypothetical protein